MSEKQRTAVLVVFVGMFEVKAREYLQGAYDYFLVPDTKELETVRPVFGKESLTIYSLSKDRREHKVCLWSS